MTVTSGTRGTVDPDILLDGVQLIGGEWVPSATGRTIDVINPANQHVIARIPRSDENDVEHAVQAAERALPAWRDMSATARGELIFKWAALIDAKGTELDSLESQEVGRPSWGPPGMGRQLRFIAGQADKVHGVSLPTHHPEAVGFTLREPYGVVGAVIPWNAPGPLFAVEVGAAIAAGNTIVIKPAEDAPLTPLALAKLALEVGIPPGVINVVTGYGAEAGAAIPAHPKVRRMAFIGSPETGRIIMAACAQNLTPLHLELGGKSPQVVFSDADLDAAVRGMAWSITLNTGQICAAGSRVVVERSIHQEVVERLAKQMEEITVGPWYEQVTMGPLVNKKQHERVLGYIDIGKESGAELVLGGGVPAGDKFDDGFFVEPTIFDKVDPDMRIAREEIFGPVLSVIPVDDEAEAFEVANGTDYGLVASIWTRDVGRAVRASRALQAGQVGVNSAFGAAAIGAPFGGYKNSGFGRNMGADSVLEWTQVKAVSMSEAGLPRR
ncbi:aldehyde dehydrogenase family protein [Phytoactinopolyspora mesophila]|uniref:Aldehyde dehydrogenase family protein n=1 Tax=Phytoactinopolyspora mesophila TaxID=2650750 RepID=A0A7K3LZM5_9ACTN|nr:aldehyde dehydrogenase family protein [Phytoactinopolyspora mesophila]NDL56491.1 aldehyde dehydrogenase family protein [Phytoactinopolyspora mesophila]